jgi:hypothetical protein
MIVFSILLKKAEDFDCFPYVRHRSGIYFLWPGPAGLGISWFVIVSCTFWIAPQSVLIYMCNLTPTLATQSPSALTQATETLHTSGLMMTSQSNDTCYGRGEGTGAMAGKNFVSRCGGGGLKNVTWRYRLFF